jgi:hypothetical protein
MAALTMQNVEDTSKSARSAPACGPMDNGFPEVNTALENEINQFYDQLPDTRSYITTCSSF